MRPWAPGSNTYNKPVGTSWGSWMRRGMSRQGLPEAQAERQLSVSGGGCRGDMPATPTSIVSERGLQMRTRWFREARFLVQGHTAQEQGWSSYLLTLLSQEDSSWSTHSRWAYLWPPGGGRWPNKLQSLEVPQRWPGRLGIPLGRTEERTLGLNSWESRHRFPQSSSTLNDYSERHVGAEPSVFCRLTVLTGAESAGLVADTLSLWLWLTGM